MCATRNLHHTGHRLSTPAWGPGGPLPSQNRGPHPHPPLTCVLLALRLCTLFCEEQKNRSTSPGTAGPIPPRTCRRRCARGEKHPSPGGSIDDAAARLTAEQWSWQPPHPPGPNHSRWIPQELGAIRELGLSREAVEVEPAGAPGPALGRSPRPSVARDLGACTWWPCHRPAHGLVIA